MITKSKKLLVLTAIAAGVIGLSACNKDKDSSNATATASAVSQDSAFEQKAAYAVGASVGSYIVNLKKSQEEYIGVLDNDLVAQGFLDALSGKTQMDNKAIEEALVALDQKVQEQMDVKAKALAQKNLEEGNQFLEANAKKDGVITTASGLQYKVITQGDGNGSPQKNDIVTVKYKGTTIDGKVFDEQVEAVELPLANLLPGWVEGVMLMSRGAKYELYIPANLAYGVNGAGDIISPNSALIFEVELVDFKKAE